MRKRYSERVRSGQRDGSVERVVSGSKEVACEARRCAAAVVSVTVGGGDGDGDGDGACGGGGGGSAAPEGWCASGKGVAEVLRENKNKWRVEGGGWSGIRRVTTNVVSAV